jgi:hypothetical protein
MRERRQTERRSFDVFFNKFLDGHPFLCRAVDLSRSGILCDVFLQPETRHDAFPLELELPGTGRRLWVWGHKVRRAGTREAIRFVSLHTEDRIALERYLREAAA